MSARSGFEQLPVVDVSGLRGDLPARQATADSLGRAVREAGFLYLSGHGMPEPLFADLREAATAFFALPLDQKMQTWIGLSRNHRGYVPEGEEVFYGGSIDRKEAFDLSLDLPPDDPDYLAGNPLLGPNQWPALPGFKEAVSRYYEAVFELGRLLMRGFALALGEDEDFFDPMITKPPSQLRLIHYPWQPDASDAPGIGAHTDYECFTLLHATAPGLEVMNGEGRWIDAPPLPGAFIVNTGDMLELLSNGEFVATSHRVRRVREERYSFPLFFNLDFHTRIAPLPRFVRAGVEPRPTVIAGEHLHAQNCQSFSYLKARMAEGSVTLPEGALDQSFFGQEARQRAR
ncbi:MAG: isopenicillin N synthase family oxygenase [Gammaproteobacteria bacterium]|nr:isopenicillin N synthase family oxygenase [Gammaproteobacteria bacterium]